MDHRRLKRLYWLTALIGVGIIVVAAALITGPEVGVQIDPAESETTDAPSLLIDDVPSVQYPDPLHLRLADERVFRFAKVVCPDAGTPEYAQALELIPKPLAFSENPKRGLRSLGTNAAGERLAEPWGLQTEFLLCGNISSAERRKSSIPHWKN